MSDADLNTIVLREIRDELRTTRTELKAEISATRTELKAEIAATRTELKAELGDLRTGVNARLEVVEHTLQDMSAQQLLAIRYMKNTFRRHGEELEGLDERVTTLETAAKPTEPTR